MGRAGIAIALASLSACSLVVPLDALESGAGGAASSSSAGGSTSTSTPASASSSASGSSGSLSSATSAGGAGEGGAGGEAAESPYAAAVKASRPLVFLRLDETEDDAFARDEMGNHDGLYQPTAVRGLPGGIVGDPSTAVAPAVSDLQGAVVMGDVVDLHGRVPLPFSLECWFRIFDDPEDGVPLQVLINKDGDLDGEREGYLLALFPQDEFWAVGFERFAAGTNRSVYAFGTAVSLAEWHHLVITSSPRAMSIFLDGQVIETGAGSSDALRDTRALLVIGANTVQNSPLIGEIDEVAIYERVLELGEITDHHQIGSGER